MKNTGTKQDGVSIGAARRIAIMANDRSLRISGPFHFDEDPITDPHVNFNTLTLDYNHRIQLDAITCLVHPTDIPYVTELLEKLQNGLSLDFHFRVITPQGSIRHLHGFGKLDETLTVEETAAQKAPSANMDTVDASTRQDREGENQGAHFLLQTCLDGMPHLVWLSDDLGNFLLFNDRWQNYTGLSIEASGGYKYISSGLIHPSQIREANAKWEYSLRYGVPYFNETLLRNVEGDYYWHLDSIYPVYNESGKVQFWVGTLINVHEEFEAEKRIQENNQLLEAIFNSSLNGIQVMQSVRDETSNRIVDFEWQYYNQVAKELFPGEELAGKRLTAHYPEAARSGLFDQFKNVVLKGDAAQFEHSFTRDGKNRWFEVSAVKLEDGVVATFHDISLRKQAELEARDTRHFIQHIANSTPDIIYVIDLREGSIVYVNGKIEDYLGLQAEEVYRLGPAVFEKLMHPDDTERRMEQIRGLSTLKEGETREIEVRLRSATGHWRWFKVRDTLFKRHSDGSVWQTIGLVEDIHDLKIAQEKIKVQLQVDRQAEKIAQIGNWQWNLTTGEVIWGENLYYLLGLDPATAQPSIKTFIEALHPGDREYFIRESQQIKDASPGPLNLFYFRVQLPDGNVRNLRAASELIVVNGERRLIGTVRDVTRDLIHEREIRERISFIETLVESSINRIAVVDRDLRYLVWNRKCEETYGLRKEEVLGKTVREVYPRIDDNPVWLDRLERSFQGAFQHFPEEKSFRTDNYYEGFYIPLKNDNGEIYAVLNILHDITDRVRAQKELRSLNESLQLKNFELRMMNEQLSTFAFVASHDLREPLRKIQVFTNSILTSDEKNLSHRGIEYFRKILVSIARMNLLIEDILSFSKIHVDSTVSAPVNLNEVLKSVMDELDETIRETRALIRSNRLPQYSGNRSQLHQLFKNLLTNAIKFQPRGNQPEIVVNGELVSGSTIDHPAARRSECYLKLDVRDNGIGIEEEFYEKVFQMFQRLHGVSEYPGTGVGLAICKKVAENHDGFITVSSKAGKGSTFTCYLGVR